MMKKLRAWVTPITAGSFLLIGITGLLMFFKVRGSLIVVAHEWLSPIFVIGAGLHIWLNWETVRKLVMRKRGLAIVGLFGALLVFSLIPFQETAEIAQEHGHGLENAGRLAAQALLNAPLSAVAELTGQTPRRLQENLGLQGIRVTSDSVTLAEAAHRSHVSPARALKAALQNVKSD